MKQTHLLPATVALTASLIALTTATTVTAAPPKGKYIDQRAVKVTMVFGGSPAERQGLERDDIITTVNGNPIRSPEDLRHYLGQAGGVARLEVIDWRTDRVNEMTVYPVGGKIGIDCEQVQLGGGTPVDPMPSPYGGKPKGKTGSRPITGR